MTNRLIRPAADDTTRERILKAAILRFSSHSYEETGLRDIAADVGVDMAYVHRSFGSKEKLYHQAVKAVIQSPNIFAGEPEDLPTALAKLILTPKGPNEIRALDIVVHSFSSPEASRVLREILQEDFIGPLMDKRPGLSERKAALITAILCGVSILKDVVGARSLQEGEGGELEQLLSQAIITLSYNDDDPETHPGALPIQKEAY